jgi:hypothetical protein
MDAAKVDEIVRSLSRGLASRRAMLTAFSAFAFSASGDLAEAKKRKSRKKRCKKKKRCDKDCCNASNCFAKSLNPDTGEVLSFGCCPSGSFCKSEVSGWPDQCCYSDETCDPQLANTRPTLFTICCRKCGEECLPLDFVCVDGSQEPLNTARLPRYRR